MLIIAVVVNEEALELRDVVVEEPLDIFVNIICYAFFGLVLLHSRFNSLTCHIPICHNDKCIGEESLSEQLFI
jgi:hypothetical protein